MVNLFEILHASAYNIYDYIYKVRKNATASARPPAAAARPTELALARIIVTQNAKRKKERKKGRLLRIVRAVVAMTRVAKMDIIQGCHPWHFF